VLLSSVYFVTFAFVFLCRIYTCQHGMHSGNTAILEKYKQEQEALRQKLAQQNLVGSGSGSGGSTGSGISSSGSVGTGGMVASATAPGGLSLKSIPSKSPNQAKSAHDT
jgi:hypothetical protein